MSNTLVINLYGGPGSGKSTSAAYLFALMKMDGFDTELVTEFAKDKVWEKSFNTLEHQEYVFAKQKHKQWRCIKDEVKFLITDSALLNCLYYGQEKTSDTFKNLVIEASTKHPTLNIFINRIKKYVPKGRMQTEEEAKEIDNVMKELVKEHYPKETIHYVNGERNSLDEFYQTTLKPLLSSRC